MKRSPMPRRTTCLARSRKRIRAHNPERQAKHFVRSYGSLDRVEFVKSLPCLVTGCPRPSENAHVVKIDGGMGLKGRAEGNAPLCRLHHRDSKHSLHELGPRSFERLHRLSLADSAARTDRAWQDYLAERGAA